MEGLSYWDLDGTMRPGALLADAILHGAEAGFIDLNDYADPANPTYEEVAHFVRGITHRSPRDFKELTDRLSDEARQQVFPWALERLDAQAANNAHVAIFSHAPDFAVRAFARGLGCVRRGRGTFFHTVDLRFSGRTALLNKGPAVNRYLREHGLKEIAFAAGDGYPDLPILRRAKHGVIVNPNPGMRLLAKEHNWETVVTEPSYV